MWKLHLYDQFHIFFINMKFWLHEKFPDFLNIKIIFTFYFYV